MSVNVQSLINIIITPSAGVAPTNNQTPPAAACNLLVVLTPYSEHSEWEIGFPDCSGGSQSPINLSGNVGTFAQVRT